MKVYKLEVVVIDHDGVGEGIASVIQNARYSNRCISPKVIGVESRDIGEWSDEHPLNHTDKQADEFKRLFSTAKAEKENCPYDSHAYDCEAASIIRRLLEHGTGGEWPQKSADEWDAACAAAEDLVNAQTRKAAV